LSADEPAQEAKLDPLTVMRVQLASDLHLELLTHRFPGEQLIAPANGADVLVLAGDIAGGSSAIELFADWPVPVLYVAGNHEAYGGTWEAVQRDLRQAAAGTPVRFLERDVVDLGGVRFLGCTLWTDYQLEQRSARRQWTQREMMQNAETCINDHRRIRTVGGGPFLPQHALADHFRSRAWLEHELSTPYLGKTVVVTHHAPNLRSIHPRYAGDITNAAFASDLPGLTTHADVWLHGHVHDSFDYRVGRCRVVANPRGYAKNRDSAADVRELQFENPAFQWSCTVDVA
jgi:predicted phosphodiesterase